MFRRREETKKCTICATPTNSVAYSFKKPYKMYRCFNCSLLFLQPVPDTEAIRSLYSEDYYKKHNLQYFSDIDDAEIESRLLLCQDGVKHEVHPYKKEGRLLEIGCASGFFLKAAQRLGWDVFGVEVSEYASRFASFRLGLGSRIINKRLEDADLPANHFDVIVLFMVLEHMPYPMTVLETAKCCLKPGGIVIMKIPNYRCVESYIFGNNWHQLSFPHHLYIFSPASMDKIIWQLRFKTLTLSTYRHFSNYINPASDHMLERLSKRSLTVKQKTGMFKRPLKLIYKTVFELIDKRLLLGEQLRVVLQKDED